MSRAIVLQWQREVIGHLVESGPPNHTRICAIAAAMVTHANPDGGRMGT